MQTARNIRSIPSFIRGLWDWTFLNSCFVRRNGQPTRIRVSDVDGLVERGGHFLFLECKPDRWDDEHEIPRGQQLTHDALLRTGAFTVIVVWGSTDTDMIYEYLRHSDTSAMLCALGEPMPTYAQIRYETGQTWEGPTAKREFQEIVRDWFQWADDNPKR